MLKHTITCLINPNVTTPISMWAPGTADRPSRGQEGTERAAHGRAVMMNWLMNANEDECKWQIPDNRRNMKSTTAGSLFRPVAENMNSWCVSGLLIPQQRQWMHHWTRGSPNHKSYGPRSAATSLYTIWSLITQQPSLHDYMSRALKMTRDHRTGVYDNVCVNK